MLLVFEAVGSICKFVRFRIVTKWYMNLCKFSSYVNSTKHDNSATQDATKREYFLRQEL